MVKFNNKIKEKIDNILKKLNEDDFLFTLKKEIRNKKIEDFF